MKLNLELTCPYCNHKQNVIMFSTYHTGDGHTFYALCPQCAQKIQLSLYEWELIMKYYKGDSK